MLRSSVIESPLDATDEILAARACAGTRTAFMSLVTRHQNRIYRLALRMSHNEADAEEITQETFLLAHRSLTSFRGESPFSTWLYRITINQALMRRRSSRRRPLQSIEISTSEVGSTEPAVAVGGEPAAAADELIDRRRLAQRVRDAVAKLDESHRAALVLRDLEELSSEEAADILGVSADVVRQRAHRARLRLRELLSSPAR